MIENKQQFAKVYVLRHSKTEFGCFGVMFDSLGVPFAVTLENEETLVPAGLFTCVKSPYHAGGYQTFEIRDVGNRTRLLLHKLNWDYQSKGCIGIAESFETLNGVPAIASSDKGFTEFWNKYKEFESIQLEIQEHYVVPPLRTQEFG